MNALSYAREKSVQLGPRVHNLVAPPGESRWIICYVADAKPVSVFGSLYESITSSTKPEVHHYVLHWFSSEDRITAADKILWTVD